LTSRVTRVRHTTHIATEKDGFVHYRPGCLCHECPNYNDCRLITETLAKGPVIPGDTRDDMMWMPKTETTPGMEKILTALKVNPDGMTVRQLSIATGMSARHVHRLVKVLRKRGIIKKLWELRREKIVDTRLRHYETTEIAHRYVISHKGNLQSIRHT